MAFSLRSRSRSPGRVCGNDPWQNRGSTPEERISDEKGVYDEIPRRGCKAACSMSGCVSWCASKPSRIYRYLQGRGRRSRRHDRRSAIPGNSPRTIGDATAKGWGQRRHNFAARADGATTNSVADASSPFARSLICRASLRSLPAFLTHGQRKYNGRVCFSTARFTCDARAKTYRIGLFLMSFCFLPG